MSLDTYSINFDPTDPNLEQIKYKPMHWHLTNMRVGPQTEIGWKYFETIRRAVFLRFWRYAGVNAPHMPNVLLIALADWDNFVNDLPSHDFNSPGAIPGKYRLYLTDVGDDEAYVNRVYFTSRLEMLSKPPIVNGQPSPYWRRIANPHRYRDFDQCSGRYQIKSYETGSKPEPPIGTYRHFYAERPAWWWLPKQLDPQRQLKPIDSETDRTRYVEPNRRYIAQNAAGGTRYTLTVKPNEYGRGYNLVQDNNGVEVRLGLVHGGLGGGRYTSIYAEPGMDDISYHRDSLPRQSRGVNYGDGGKATQWGFEPKICASYQEMITQCAEQLFWQWPILPGTPQGDEFIRNFNGERFGWAPLWQAGVEYHSGDVVQWPDSTGTMSGWRANPFLGVTTQEPSDGPGDWNKIPPYGGGGTHGYPDDPIMIYMDDERWGCNGSVLELALWIASNTDGIYDWVYDTDKPFAPLDVLYWRCKAVHGTPQPSDESINNAYPLAHGNWHRCWPGMGWPKNIDPDNGGLVLPGIRYVTEWREGLTYDAGVRRYGAGITMGGQTTNIYRSICQHTGTLDNRPGSGDNWQTYWEPLFNFSKHVIPPGSTRYWEYQDNTLSDATIAAGAGVSFGHKFWPGLYNYTEPTIDYAALDINHEDLEQMRRRHNRAVVMDDIDYYEVTWQQVKSLWDVLSCLVYIGDITTSVQLEQRGSYKHISNAASAPAAWQAAVNALLIDIETQSWEVNPDEYRYLGWSGLIIGNNGSYSCGGQHHQMRLTVTGGYMGGKYYGEELLVPVRIKLLGHMQLRRDAHRNHIEPLIIGLPDGTHVTVNDVSYLDDPPPPAKISGRVVFINLGHVEQYVDGDTHILDLPILSGIPSCPDFPDDGKQYHTDSICWLELVRSGFVNAVYRLDFSNVPESVFEQASYLAF